AIFDVPSAGDRHNVVALSQHPRERQLRRRAALLFRKLLDLAHQLDILLEILAGEARMVLAEIVVGEIVRRLDLAGEEPAAKRRISNIADAELAHRREYFRLGVAAPQRQLGLDGGDRRGRMRRADRPRRGLAEAEIADLPFVLEP